mmetsp:Transcript_35088/g.74847  ORF Transcript_35088/g.74847 Transcript_35088/m.74847 type:complete len:180 (+) Transcript_35088:239-778(+)|eukprot:CAMPEP_0172533152 /NCGR_PEP_ID=MMETSP1067-20121228/5952_1 /TAXON_ID=265564 ORGANISM="Thalassiosira punctigera, Strain Tpunct2005C2" /NCGR_SAMPLE_ID=MMETSP1067 /ASSEMBLY_ACC=CAM_ASM_000444 /LENGTH=179 /DNA_ID=CAMNT_0013317755 /DNA_START=191 /DNA_END=730 /DNA_ORIENTATION=-
MKAAISILCLFVAQMAAAFVVPAPARAVVSQRSPTATTTTLNIFGTKNKETTEAAEPELLMDPSKDMIAEDSAEEDEQKNLFQKIKDAGVAGSVSLFLWEGAFWAISIPVACFAFFKLNGSWPNFGDSEDMAKVGAEAFAFANVARLALPLRIGLAVTTTPWVQENIVDKFMTKDEGEE